MQLQFELEQDSKDSLERPKNLWASSVNLPKQTELGMDHQNFAESWDSIELSWMELYWMELYWQKVALPAEALAGSWPSAVRRRCFGHFQTCWARFELPRGEFGKPK